MTLHRHRWVIIGVRATAVIDDWGGQTDKTRTLLRCERCGRLKTKLVKGTWSLEQLGGRPA